MKHVDSVGELTQLRPPERAALSDYLARLALNYGDHVRRVILFGSRARGEGDAESDVDVLVVIDQGDWRFHDEVALASYEPSLNNGVLITPLTMNAADYEWNVMHRAPLYRSIERDGIDLWMRQFEPS